MPVWIHMAKMLPQPSLRRLHGDFSDVEPFFAHGDRRPIPYDQPHRFKYMTAAESSLDLSRNQQSLVAVVVQDGAEPLQVFPRKGVRYALHDRVADAIRVAQSLPLNDLDVKLRNSRTTHTLPSSSSATVGPLNAWTWMASIGSTQAGSLSLRERPPPGGRPPPVPPRPPRRPSPGFRGAPDSPGI